MKLKQIIEKAQRRDKQAQKALFMKTHEHLMATALRYVPDTSSAEDIVQESYVRIYKAIPKFKYINDSASMGWMRRITATEALRYLKNQKRWDNSRGIASTETSITPHALTTDYIYKMLMDLPENQRLVFNLFAIEGYSHKEIAQRMNLAESSSRALLARARSKLQTKLKNSVRHERA